MLFQLVYCGHEYAVQNLKFGHHVEPDNLAIQEKIAWVKKRRDDNLPSVPSTIGNYLMFTYSITIENNGLNNIAIQEKIAWVILVCWCIIAGQEKEIKIYIDTVSTRHLIYIDTKKKLAILPIFTLLRKCIILFSGEEKQINPFMRVGEASVQAHVNTTDPVETMTAVRSEKDNWRPPKA